MKCKHPRHDIFWVDDALKCISCDQEFIPKPEPEKCAACLDSLRNGHICGTRAEPEKALPSVEYHKCGCSKVVCPKHSKPTPKPEEKCCRPTMPLCRCHEISKGDALITCGECDGVKKAPKPTPKAPEPETHDDGPYEDCRLCKRYREIAGTIKAPEEGECCRDRKCVKGIARGFSIMADWLKQDEERKFRRELLDFLSIPNAGIVPGEHIDRDRFLRKFDALRSLP